MVIDHIGLAVSTYEKSKAFYAQALAPLGSGLILEIEDWAGFRKDGKPEFCARRPAQTRWSIPGLIPASQ
jgi:catechol 2,3-dioxygenase-like lactoylglutathione lyase family enzyme